MEKPQRIKGLSNLGEYFDLSGEELKKVGAQEQSKNENTQKGAESKISATEFNATQGLSHLHQQETMPENGILTSTSSMPEMKPGGEQAKIVSIDTKTPSKANEGAPLSVETENTEIIETIKNEVDHWYEKLQKEPKDPKFVEKNRQDFLDFQLSPYGWLKETLENRKGSWGKKIQSAPNDIEKGKIARAQEFDTKTLRALDEAYARNIQLPLVRTKDMEGVFPANGKVILDQESLTKLNTKLGTTTTAYRVENIFQKRNDQYVELETPEGKKFTIRIEDYIECTQQKEDLAIDEEVQNNSDQTPTIESIIQENKINTEAQSETMSDLEAFELLSELDKVVKEIKEIEKNKPVTATEPDQNVAFENINNDVTPISVENKKSVLGFIKKTINKTRILGGIMNTKTTLLKDSVKNSKIVKKINASKQEQQLNNAEVQKQITKKEQDRKMVEEKEEIEQDKIHKPVSYFTFENIGNEYIRDILINHEIGVFDMRKYGTENKVDADKPYDVFLKEIKKISKSEGIVICNTLGVAVVCTNLNSPENKGVKIPTETWVGEKMNKKNFKVILTDPTNGEQLSIEHLTLLEAHDKYEQQTKWVFQESEKRYKKSLQ